MATLLNSVSGSLSISSSSYSSICVFFWGSHIVFRVFASCISSFIFWHCGNTLFSPMMPVIFELASLSEGSVYCFSGYPEVHAAWGEGVLASAKGWHEGPGRHTSWSWCISYIISSEEGMVRYAGQVTVSPPLFQSDQCLG